MSRFRRGSRDAARCRSSKTSGVAETLLQTPIKSAATKESPKFQEAGQMPANLAGMR